VFDGRGYYAAYAPTILKNPIVVEYCFDYLVNSNHDYVVAVVQGFKPKRDWEVSS